MSDPDPEDLQVEYIREDGSLPFGALIPLAIGALLLAFASRCP